MGPLAAMPYDYHAVNIAQARQEPYLRVDGKTDRYARWDICRVNETKLDFSGKK